MLVWDSKTQHKLDRNYLKCSNKSMTNGWTVFKFLSIVKNDNI